MRLCLYILIGLAGFSLCASGAWAQSSSLYAKKFKPVSPQQVAGPNSRVDRLSPAISKASFSAVQLPKPRSYALHDLITIIIRESIENKTSSITNAKKSIALDTEVAKFPSFSSMLELRPRTSATTNNPALDFTVDNDFRSKGLYKRKDSFTTRLTARIIDIKPNGTMVLEARKRIVNDKEDVTLVLTGTCRKQDIASDNTILSTQIYDMFLRKQAEGEMRRVAEKGVLTRLLDTIFNF